MLNPLKQDEMVLPAAMAGAVLQALRRSERAESANHRTGGCEQALEKMQVLQKENERLQAEADRLRLAVRLAVLGWLLVAALSALLLL